MAHLREVLGDETYESLANAGGNMTTAAMAAYAFAQIDQVDVLRQSSHRGLSEADADGFRTGQSRIDTTGDVGRGC